ncbi:MAG: carbohydrate binding domain-containing protein [Pseudomonadota bacterium]
MNAPKRLYRTSTLLAAALVVAGCFDNGDGPESIQNEPVAPLPPLPVGFCDTINFELVCELPEIINFNGGSSVIIDNPDQSGINTSDAVAQMQKFPDQVFGGTRLNYDELVDFGDGTSWAVKVWSPRPVAFTFKLEETMTTFGPERVGNHSGSSMWEQFCFDFAGATNPAVVYNGVTLIFDNGTLGQADTDPANWTFFYDDIEQVSDCGSAGGGAGVPNLATNGGFENGSLDGWVAQENGGTINVDATDSNGGDFSVAIGAGRLDNPILRQERIGAGEINPGDDVTVTFDMRGNAANGGVINVELFTEGDMGVTGSELLGSIADPTTGYTTYTFVGSIPEPTMSTGSASSDLSGDVSGGVTLQLGFVCGDVADCVVDVNIDNVIISNAEGTGGGGGGGGGGSGFDGGLVTNGDFEAGTSPWLAGVSNPIGSENVIDDMGNSVYFVDVMAAGDAFNVNLSQILPITQDQTYTLTFRARSNVSRSILAGIGLAGGDFSNTTQSVDLTTDWQNFTLELTAAGFGDPAARVLFDLGAEVGQVFIDDVRLVEGVPFDSGLVTNGDFEAGISPWLNGVTNPIGSENVIDDMGNNVYFVDVMTAGDAFNVNLSQILEIIQDETYTLSFRARSNVSRSILAGIGLAGGDFSNTTETVALTTDWQNFTFELTAAGFGDPAARVLFDLGAEVGQVFIDDISLVVSTGGGGGTGGGGAMNLAVNGDLETGDQSGWVNNPQDGSIEVVDTEAASGVYSLNISTSYSGTGPAPAPPIAKQERVGAGSVNPDEQITISFDLKGTAGAGGVLNVELFSEIDSGGVSASVLLESIGAVPADWQTFTYTPTTGSDVSGGVTLQFAAACGPVENCAVDVFIDNVVITAGSGGGTGGGGTGGGGATSDVDFESGMFTFNDFDGGTAAVVANPDASGLNTSVQVAQMQKFPGATFGGSTLVLDSSVALADGDSYTMLVRATRPVQVTFELEGVNQERTAFHSGSGTWENLCFDFTGVSGDVTGYTIIFDNGIPGSADTEAANWTFQFDDIQQTSSACPAVPAHDSGLLTNGDFESGTTPWLAGVSDPIAAGNIVTLGGNNVYFVNIESPDPNAPFAVNLSQKLTITPGTTYTLSFRARASVPRSIIAGIGLSDGDFSNNSMPVDLNTGWQDISLELAATGFGDANSRVLFDLNGEAGEVYIDNVSLVEAPPFDSGLLTNGDFESGTSPWLAGVTDPIAGSSIIMDDGSNVYFANITSPDPNAPFAVNLSQKLTITPGETYTLSFRARSNGDRSIIAGIGLSDGDFSNNSVPVDLTATYQDYSLDLTATGFGDANSRVLFDLNGEAGEVYIDNVSLVVAAGGGTGGGGTGGGGATGNLAVNGDLETGDVTGWTNFDNGGTIAVSTAEASGGIYSLNFAVSSDGTAGGNPVVKQERIGQGTVQPNQAITVSFDLKGTITQPGAAVIAEFFSEGTTVVNQILESYTDSIADWQTFTYNVTTSSDVSGGITLQLVGACGAVAGCDINMFVDNVSITID